MANHKRFGRVVYHLHGDPEVEGNGGHAFPVTNRREPEHEIEERRKEVLRATDLKMSRRGKKRVGLKNN